MVYDHLPRQRQLNRCQREDAEELLRLKVNTKLLQQHLCDGTGKVVTLKDVQNMQTGIHVQSEKNNLEALVARLRKIHGKQCILQGSLLSVIYPMGRPFCFCGNPNNNVLLTLLTQVASQGICNSDTLLYSLY